MKEASALPKLQLNGDFLDQNNENSWLSEKRRYAGGSCEVLCWEMADGEPDEAAGFETYVHLDTLHSHSDGMLHGGHPSSSDIDSPVPIQEASSSNVRLRDDVYEITNDYTAAKADELNLRRGSVVRFVSDSADRVRVKGVIDGKEGHLPSSYVRLIGKPSQVISPNEITLTEQIGEGAAAVVHIAYYNKKKVAFKKMRTKVREGEKTDIERIVEDITREAAYFSNLRHTNIVTLLGIVTEEPMIGLILELCEGSSLADVYARMQDAAVPKRIITNWAMQISSAMVAIHKAQLIHRDLKMNNVLVLQKVCYCGLPTGHTPDRHNADLYLHEEMNAVTGFCRKCKGRAIDRLTLKITDFGLAREQSDRFSTTAGSNLWISPEAYQSHRYSEASDVWAFGVVLWELITRKIPYANMNEHTVPFMVSNFGIRLPITKEFPSQIADLLKRCWRTEPDERPSFRQIEGDLREYLNELKNTNDPYASLEQVQLEKQIVHDLSHMKLTNEQLEMYDLFVRKHNEFDQDLNKRKNKKPVDKNTIGTPLTFSHICSVKQFDNNLEFYDGQCSPSGGTLPRKKMELYSPEKELKTSLSVSQPNLNLIHSSDPNNTLKRTNAIRTHRRGLNDDHMRPIDFDASPPRLPPAPHPPVADNHQQDHHNHKQKRNSDVSSGFGEKKTTTFTRIINTLFPFQKKRNSRSIDSDDVSVETTQSRSHSVSSTNEKNFIMYNSFTRSPAGAAYLGDNARNGRNRVESHDELSVGTPHAGKHRANNRKKPAYATPHTTTYTRDRPGALSNLPPHHPSSSPSTQHTSSPGHSHIPSTSTSPTITPLGIDDQVPTSTEEQPYLILGDESRSRLSSDHSHPDLKPLLSDCVPLDNNSPVDNLPAGSIFPESGPDGLDPYRVLSPPRNTSSRSSETPEYIFNTSYAPYKTMTPNETRQSNAEQPPVVKAPPPPMIPPRSGVAVGK